MANTKPLIVIQGNSKEDLETHIDGISKMAELKKKNLNNETKNAHSFFVETTIKEHFKMFYKNQHKTFLLILDYREKKKDERKKIKFPIY